jgi:YqaJ-like viral recombinase domain
MPLPSELEQGSDEWRQIRCGKVTGSRINDVLAKLKSGGEAKTRADYRMELVAERLTGVPEEQYVNGYMRWGTEYEPLARAAYEVVFDVVLEQVGFVIHPTMPFAGCSPDAFLGDKGIAGFKCPKTTTHLRWRQKNSCPEEHVAQLYWELCCTGREWADFVSYDPRLPEPLQLFAVRVFPEKELMIQMEHAVYEFNAEIEASIGSINAVAGVREVA